MKERKFRERLLHKRFGTVVVIGHCRRVGEDKYRLHVRCDCGLTFYKNLRSVQDRKGGCPRCNPQRAPRDFQPGCTFLTNASRQQLARAALRGSDASLLELVRRVIRNDRE